jgi:hypothetical protein
MRMPLRMVVGMAMNRAVSMDVIMVVGVVVLMTFPARAFP